MKEIVAKAPTRVDLAGGTLDLWPIYAFLEECFTTNVSIDIYTHAKIQPRTDKKVILDIHDTGDRAEYQSWQECAADENPKFSLLRKHVAFWKPTEGFELSTRSESPIGGGLGGSSSLCISILGAFAKWQKRNLSHEEMVRIVSNIEAQLLKVPTGTQDYWPAVVGGLNVLRYNSEGCRVEPVKNWQGVMDENFLLVYTGKPHHSGMNNWQVLKDTIDGKPSTWRALTDLKLVASNLRDTVNAGHWGDLSELFLREFEARVRISPVFSSPEIERLRDVALRAGAQAVKICGAGGGGCVLVWCGPGNKGKVAEACQSAGFQILNAKPVSTGLTVN